VGQGDELVGRPVDILGREIGGGALREHSAASEKRPS